MGEPNYSNSTNESQQLVPPSALTVIGPPETSASPSATAAATSTDSSSTNAVSLSPSASSSNSDGLSIGARAGIGVGAAVGAILLVSVLFVALVLARRRRSSAREPGKTLRPFPSSLLPWKRKHLRSYDGSELGENVKSKPELSGQERVGPNASTSPRSMDSQPTLVSGLSALDASSPRVPSTEVFEIGEKGK